MLTKTDEGTAAVSRVRLLLVLLPVIALLAALAPAAASAQDDGSDDTDGPCTVRLSEDADDPTRANFAVDCGDTNIVNANLSITDDENGSNVVDGDETDCSENSSTDFDCEPADDDGPRVSGALANAQDQEVCADPPLTVTFEVDLEEGSPATATIEDYELTGCDDSSGSSGDTDDGALPEGGVDSGAGGVADSSAPAAGGVIAIVALMLTGGALLARRARASR